MLRHDRRTIALSTELLESVRTGDGLGAELAALRMVQARLVADRDVERFMRELEGAAGAQIQRAKGASKRPPRDR
jgi:hypothetical protein